MREVTYRRNTPGQADVFPITKVTVRRKPQPQSLHDPNVIRFKWLEGPVRWYFARSYHEKAFMKTVVLSFILCWPAYQFVYMVARCNARAQIMGKMDPHFTSDQMKEQIVNYKKRKEQGQVEAFEGSEV